MGDEKVLKLYIASSDFINKLHVCKGPWEFGNLLRWRQLKCGSKESELLGTMVIWSLPKWESSDISL
jgi:hypothetical protein